MMVMETETILLFLISTITPNYDSEPTVNTKSVSMELLSTTPQIKPILVYY